LRVQSEQLPTESQVFEDEVLAGAKRADDSPEEMPERHPQPAQKDARSQYVVLRTHLRKCVPGPIDFFEDPSRNTEQYAWQKTVRKVNRRDKSFQKQKNGQDQRGGNEKHRIPTYGNQCSKHLGEQGRDRKRQNSGDFRQGLLTDEVRCARKLTQSTRVQDGA
jgi:hypothetical protein